MMGYSIGWLHGRFCITWYDDSGARHRNSLGTDNANEAERLAPSLFSELLLSKAKSVKELWNAKDRAEARFEQLYIPEPNSGCWLWEGRTGHGYGRLKYAGHQISAHRLSWILHRGEIPQGMWVLHKCDTPLCVSPDHLFLGTHLDNVRDRERKGRGHLRPGEAHPEAKLTEEDVRAIRSDARSQMAIARDYGISDSQVANIQLRRAWRHLMD